MFFLFGFEFCKRKVWTKFCITETKTEAELFFFSSSWAKKLIDLAYVQGWKFVL